MLTDHRSIFLIAKPTNTYVIDRIPYITVTANDIRNSFPHNLCDHTIRKKGAGMFLILRLLLLFFSISFGFDLQRTSYTRYMEFLLVPGKIALHCTFFSCSVRPQNLITASRGGILLLPIKSPPYPSISADDPLYGRRKSYGTSLIIYIIPITELVE
jgi:hypothetical protein